jgi:hypothetical protein
MVVILLAFGLVFTACGGDDGGGGGDSVGGGNKAIVQSWYEKKETAGLLPYFQFGTSIFRNRPNGYERPYRTEGDRVFISDSPGNYAFTANFTIVGSGPEAVLTFTNVTNNLPKEVYMKADTPYYSWQPVK